MVAYGKGLNEKGFSILNKFGAVCGMGFIRCHGHHWAKFRNALDEIPRSGIWKLTIDNLNFSMKMAKSIGLQGMKRQLNLLTAQVASKFGVVNNNSIPDDNIDSDSENSSGAGDASDFTEMQLNEDQAWKSFISSLFSVYAKSLNNA